MSDREKNNGSITQEQYAFYLRVGYSYTGYVDGIGEVSPATFVKGSMYNSLSKMYNIARNIASIVVPSLSPEHEAKKQQEEQEYNRKKARVKDELTELIGKRYAEILQESMFKDVSPEYKNYRDKYNALRIKLQNKSQSPYSVIYKSDIPSDIINTSIVQEYFKYYNTQSNNPKQQYLTQNPDYYLTDYQKKQKENAEWRQKAYQNWYNADPIASQGAISLGYGVAAVPVLLFSPEIAGTIGIQQTLGLTVGKGAVSWISQSIFNGSPKEVNYAAVLGDVAPGNLSYIGPLLGSAVEWKPLSSSTKFRIVGYNKPTSDFLIESYLGYMGMGIGHFSGNTVSPLYREMMNSSVTSVFTYGSTTAVYYKLGQFSNMKDK